MAGTFFRISIMTYIFLYCNADITGWTQPKLASGTGSGSITATSEIPETKLGTTTITIAATSSIVGANKKLEYTLQNGGPFSINSTSGILSVDTQLDFETQSQYTFQVIAKDNNSSGTANITLSIGNVNPEFSEPTKSVCLPDGSSAGTKATSVKALLDANTSGAITYSLAGQDFAINATTGVISSTVAKVDKKTVPSYTLTVTGTRAGALTTETAGTKTIKITVDDCSAASLTAPFILFTLLIAAMSTIG